MVTKETVMRPMAAALTGALIAGVGMYAIGTRAAQSDSLQQAPALVQTMDGRYAYAPAGSLQPLAFNTSPTPGYGAFTPVTAAPQVVQVPQPVYQTAPQPVYQTVQRAQQTRTVYREAARPTRSWKKTALVVGGSAGTGAGVGAIVGGKKGALIGAAIGGGAASIYEATRR